MNNEIDIAICATPDAYSQTVFERLFTEKVVLLLNKDHPFNQKDDIYLSDLAGEELLITNRDCPFRGIFENKLIGNNCIPSYGLEVSNLLTLKYYVQSGFGPAIVPLISVTPPPENTVVKNIADFEAGLTIGILMKNSFEYSPSIKALIKMLKTEFVS